MVKMRTVNTQLLNEYIKKSGLKIGKISEILGYSRQIFDRKRKGEINFRAPEVYVLCDLLKIPDDMKPKIFSF